MECLIKLGVVIIKYISLLAVLIITVTGCSTVKDPKKDCIEKDGVWTLYNDIYPDERLSSQRRNKFTCRKKTYEENKSCSSIRDCKGACIAPENSTAGSITTGKCSAFYYPLMHEEENRQIFSAGVVGPLNVSLDSIREKLNELQKYRELWRSKNILSYRFTSDTECFCIRTKQIPETIVKNGVLISGPNSVDGLFNIIEDEIRNLDKSTTLNIQFHEGLGLPLVIDYNYDGGSDQGYTIKISNFHLIKE